MNKEEVQRNCKVIQEFIDSKVEPGDIIGLQAKLLEVSSITGLSAETLSHAKGCVLKAQSKAIEQIRATDPDITATALKMRIEGQIHDVLTLYEYAERLNAATTHVIDALRSQISLYKSEQETARFQK